MSFKKSLFYYLIFIVPLYIVFISLSPLNLGVDLTPHYAKSYSVAFNTKTELNAEHSAFRIDSNFHKAITTLWTDQELTRQLKFTDTTALIDAPGAILYPPLLYYPNALALKLSKNLDLSIKTSFHLMRAFNLIICIALSIILLYLSNSLRPIILLYLSIPTVIIQSFTGVIQGYTYLLMAISIITAINIIRNPSIHYHRYLFAISSGIMVLYAPSYLPLLLLPLILVYLNKLHITKIDILTPLIIIPSAILWFVKSTSITTMFQQNSYQSALSSLQTLILSPTPFINKLITTYTEYSDWFFANSFINTYQQTHINQFTYDMPVIFVTVILLTYALIASQTPRSALPRGTTTAFLYLIITITLSTAILIFIGFPTQHEDYIVGIHGRYHTWMYLPLLILISTIKPITKLSPIFQQYKVYMSIFALYLIFVASFIQSLTSRLF